MEYYQKPSRISERLLALFMELPYETELEDPEMARFIGENDREILINQRITNIYQLVGIFMMNRTKNCDHEEWKNKTARYLSEKLKLANYNLLVTLLYEKVLHIIHID